MNSRLDSFKKWAEDFCSDLPARYSSTVADGGEFEPDMCWLRIEADKGPMGDLYFWENGSADATVFDSEGKLLNFQSEITELGSWEGIEPSRFEKKFIPFTRVFSPDGKHV